MINDRNKINNIIKKCKKFQGVKVDVLISIERLNKYRKRLIESGIEILSITSGPFDNIRKVGLMYGIERRPMCSKCGFYHPADEPCCGQVSNWES